MTVVPASTASTAARPSTAADTVCGPTTGTSKRMSCCRLLTFTTTPPRPYAQPRRMAASVPSSASTARTVRRRTTTVCPISIEANCLAWAKP